VGSTRQRGDVTVLPDPHHEVVLDDAAGHVGVDNEGQPAEHLALLERD
jgi:hypothetical protein